MVILETIDLKKTYGKGDTAVNALNGINLKIENGEFTAIVGSSGSGKSTLLHMLGGLDRPTSGKVFVNGKDIFSLGDEELTVFRRRKTGFVFQSYNLVPVLSVYENIVLPIQLDGGSVDADYIGEVVSALGLEQRLASLPNQLSGGQQQRVAIARALVNAPAVLLADEPSGNLDTQNREEIHRLFFELREKLGQTIVIVTHDDRLAGMADRRITMSDGLIR